MYALPLLLPSAKYLYRSFEELSHFVPGLTVLNNIWAFTAILLFTEALLAILIYNFLGIYIEKMNSALGFFRKLGRSVLDGSKIAVSAVSVEGASRAVGGLRRVARSSSTAVVKTTRSVLRKPVGRVLSTARRVSGNARAATGRFIRSRPQTAETQLPWK